MKNNTAKITRCALMAAIMCVLCPLSIPIGPIPVSLSIMVLLLTLYILGTASACISYVIYLLLGAAGLPVFSGFQGGLAKLSGPTGGYLAGFLLMLLISGIIMEKVNRKPLLTIIGFMLGVAADYVVGTAWFVMQTNSEIGYALSVCVYPFILVDLAKIMISVFLGISVRKALLKASLI